MSSTAVETTGAPPAVGDGSPNGAAPTVAVTGGFDVAIVHNGTTYALNISVPTKAGDAYRFNVTEKKGDAAAATIVGFGLLNQKNWNVEVKLPHAIGPVQVVDLHVGQGVVPDAAPS